MKGYAVYTKIQQLKEQGFKCNAVAKMLNIHRNTVSRYWDMTADDYDKSLYNINCKKKLDEYRDIITHWLSEYPTLSSAQVCDWLKEHYSAFFTERTVSRYVQELRKLYGLKKCVRQRDYEAVPELPQGQQIQVDFGEKWMQSVDSSRVKVRFCAFVLSHSRYKYVEFLDRPFTSVDLVNACHNCFRYIGGMPVELVFDQDSVVSVSENYGDIIHTYEFEKFRQDCRLQIYLCRAADPESKGKIENVVRYVKYNFLENRLYPGDIGTLNYCVWDWLDRTANVKVHGTTKKVPAQVFADEREHLRPLLNAVSDASTRIYRTVRKDNTIVYESNRYSVPLGTYNNQSDVGIEVENGILRILTTFGEPICEHTLSAGRGELIKNTNHSRDTSSKIDSMQKDLDLLLRNEATDFLKTIRTEKARYSRDQFGLLKILCEKYGVDKVLKAIGYCKSNDLSSAVYVRDYLAHSEKQKSESKVLPISVSDNKYHVTTQKRSLEVYAKAGEAK